MSATPIPRTLSEIHAGLRTVSIIATPPARRTPVRTIVDAFSESTVAAALQREKSRNGQSLVVCPRIPDIAWMHRRLRSIVPELRLTEIHGRMPIGQIDEAMMTFARGLTDILLATNIVESGLDLPRANTIVIWRPEKFGLAQLHQLRGRVGRGRTKSFAYLMTDPDAPPKGAALSRLETLGEYSGSGAGFEISNRDLDLRGGGDLLSEEQSGHIKVLGSSLYKHLLARAMQTDDFHSEEWTPELICEVPAKLPKLFVQDEDIRLGLYAHLFKCHTEAQLEDFEEDLEERFGDMPDEASSLVSLAKLRMGCKRLGILRLEAGPEGVAVAFRTDTKIPTKRSGLRNKFRIEGDRWILSRSSGLAERMSLLNDVLNMFDES